MWSTVIYIKASIFVIALLMVFAPQQTSAQELFNGVVTYKMSMNGASAQTYTVYYRGHDQMTDMPLTKLRTLYLSEEKNVHYHEHAEQAHGEQFRLRCRDSVC